MALRFTVVNCRLCLLQKMVRICKNSAMLDVCKVSFFEHDTLVFCMTLIPWRLLQMSFLVGFAGSGKALCFKHSQGKPRIIEFRISGFVGGLTGIVENCFS